MTVTVHGLLLAAGAGRRMGKPKALVDDWLVRAASALRDGGCDDVTVVLGAEFERARALLEGAEVAIVEATDWADGMGASLRAGLAALESAAEPDDAALVTLVDLPDVGTDVVRRVLARGLRAAGRPVEPAAGQPVDRAVDVAAETVGPIGRQVLCRAAYAGKPGHPVLIGRDHWAGVRAEARGDQGARSYLASHPVELVECGDLATGRDVDSRPIQR